MSSGELGMGYSNLSIVSVVELIKTGAYGSHYVTLRISMSEVGFEFGPILRRSRTEAPNACDVAGAESIANAIPRPCLQA